MRIIVLAFILVLTSCSTNTVKKDTFQNEKYEQEYLDLVEKLNSNSDLEKFIRIRNVYVKTKLYQPYFGSDILLDGAIFEALKEKDWPKCIEHANKLLTSNYTSLVAHYALLVCYKETEKLRLAADHNNLLDGFIESIWTTGDGKTMKTAFQTISTSELRAFIQLQGLNIVRQSLIRDKNGVYDLMTVKRSDDDEEFNLYFNITQQMSKGFGQ